MFPSTPIRLTRTFLWSVPSSGYYLRLLDYPAWRRLPGGFVIDRDEHDRKHFPSYGYRRHGEPIIFPRDPLSDLVERTPLTDAALFQNFARLDGDEAILQFATEHGCLS